jgi:anion-transporting  ArsA/GET3 family ATPase
MAAAMFLSSSQRVVFVTGKGGVGKSTVAAALARAEADRNDEVILIEFEGSTAAARAVGEDSEGIRHLGIDYFGALVDIMASILNSRLLARMLVNHRAVRRLVRAIPALRELAILDRVHAIVQARPGLRAIVDFPASGHGLDWLRVPVAAERFLRAGPAAELCRRLRAQMLAPEHSAIVVVSTVEPVVASETRQLCERLAEELGRTPSLLVANRIPASPTPEQLEHLHRQAHVDPVWAPFLAAAREDRALARDAGEGLEALRAIAAAPLVRIPELHLDPAPRDLRAYFENAL